jgi:hypothetical protein
MFLTAPRLASSVEGKPRCLRNGQTVIECKTGGDGSYSDGPTPHLVVSLIVTVSFKQSLESAEDVSHCTEACQLAVDKMKHPRHFPGTA